MLVHQLKILPVFAGVVMFFFAAAGLAAPVYVQGNYSAPQTPQKTVPVTYTAAQTTGNLNVVIVGWNDSNAVVSAGSIPTRTPISLRLDQQ